MSRQPLVSLGQPPLTPPTAFPLWTTAERRGSQIAQGQRNDSISVAIIVIIGGGCGGGADSNGDGGAQLK
ncbi:unnamed protein product [Enterobius vermicularis]|uniref:Uncharacterized protein n=1 Tax=Enterobius vermicularis TaxID=51028 RepID=A0A0N4V577_ENTVE|nr:unnamed protein product [Enterobius vermicularis]